MKPPSGLEEPLFPKSFAQVFSNWVVAQSEPKWNRRFPDFIAIQTRNR